MSTARSHSHPRDQVFAPLKAPNAGELIVRRIGEAIGSGLLEPGERLPTEIELSTMLAVAPMTLRQAIAILREAGLVETRRGKHGGTFVARNVVDALAARRHTARGATWRDFCDWRRAVSGEAAALAAERASPAQLSRLEHLAADVEGRAAQDFPAFRLADSRFHMAIAEMSGSPSIQSAETTVQAELGEALASIAAPVLARRQSATGHAPIIAAIALRDGGEARAAMLRHVEATHDWVVGLRAAPPT